MMLSSIYELGAATEVPVIVAAHFSSKLEVWDVSISKKLAEIDGVYDFGAGLLAIHPRGEHLVSGRSAGSSGRIAAYDLATKEMVWEKRNIKYPSRLRFGGSGRYLYYTFGAWPNYGTQRVDALTGESDHAYPNTYSRFPGPSGLSLVQDSSKKQISLGQEDSGGGFNVRHTISARASIMDVAFGPISLCVAECGGPVRCIDSADASEIWIASPHVTKLHYCREDSNFYAVTFNTSTAARHLVRFDAHSGTVLTLAELHNSGAQAFVPAVERLISGSGEMEPNGTGGVLS